MNSVLEGQTRMRRRLISSPRHTSPSLKATCTSEKNSCKMSLLATSITPMQGHRLVLFSCGLSLADMCGTFLTGWSRYHVSHVAPRQISKDRGNREVTARGGSRRERIC